MSAQDNGGPAFPARPDEHFHGGMMITAHHGMSLRDWFAGQALAGMGMWSPSSASIVPDQLQRAVWAYAQADIMLEVRK